MNQMCSVCGLVRYSDLRTVASRTMLPRLDIYMIATIYCVVDWSHSGYVDASD